MDAGVAMVTSPRLLPLPGKWHQGLSCASRDDHCYHPLNHGFDYFYGMPFELLSDCQAFHTPELHRRLRVRLWVSTVVLALIPLLLLVPTCARWFPVPWPVILAFALLALLFFASWFSSYGFTRRWNCVLMRNHEILQQPVRLERLTWLTLKEALAFIDRYPGSFWLGAHPLPPHPPPHHPPNPSQRLAISFSQRSWVMGTLSVCVCDICDTLNSLLKINKSVNFLSFFF